MSQQKSKKQDDKDLEDLPVDLTFCFQSQVILQEELKKIEYIGTYTVSNSKGAMSKMIGSQIYNKLQNQEELEKHFEELIIEKSSKVDLVEEEDINRLNKEINKCAEELKESTNSICKTLAENPDIPKNLIKAKRDQKLLLNDLQKIQEDLVNGKFDNYNIVNTNIINKKINIDDLRKDEMKLFRELKKLNEDLAKEEADYNKDQAEMNQSLFRMKKLLAKTKLEENIFIDYQKNHIFALNDLHQSNFREEESKMRKEIEDKRKERENITKLNEFVYTYLKEQKHNYELQKMEWELKKKEKEAINEKIRNNLYEKNQLRRKNIDELTKKIQNYREANNHLEEVASQLNYTNFSIIHSSPDKITLPPINPIPEKKIEAEPEQIQPENVQNP